MVPLAYIVNRRHVTVMFTILVVILAGAAVAVAVLAAAFVLGMRTKSRLVVGLLVALARVVVNPRQMRQAGRPGAYASVIHHRGRRTGRAYETPVGVVRDGDTFVIALPYGPRTQWLRNVLGAGEAELVTEGRTVRVDRPEVIQTRDVADRFSRTDQRLFRLLATTECLRLHPAPEGRLTAVEPLAA
jgi:deazaflavin-dependent oxidoreductase (nitroreductase family)